MKEKQASDKSWISWSPLFRRCVSPTALRRRRSDQDGMIKRLFSIAYVTSRYGYLSPFFHFDVAERKTLPFLHRVY